VGEIAISDDNRVAVDLTDGAGLLTRAVPGYVVVSLTVDASAETSGTITSAVFFGDVDGDSFYATLISTDPVVTVPPGTTGYAAVHTTPAR